ncbi:MarR family winged helix-turn-helix transcriptional regulator [Sphingomonas sp. MMS24-J13]|uniref:MarR family winged helix-turn-helix transcriptional regulator n=1 Tax=Sphingomonas sp. MMS24-J13 TaxID=3238686 RepID=UPI00384AF357
MGASDIETPPSAAADRPVLNRHIHVAHHLTVLANAMTSGGSRIYLDRFDFGLNEGRITAVLGHTPGMTAAELGAAMAMNKSIVSRSLWTMLERGLIRQTGSARARRNWLTEEGYRIEAQVVAITLARERLLIDGFSAEEKAQLLSFLTRMQANLAKVAEFEVEEGLASAG